MKKTTLLATIALTTLSAPALSLDGTLTGSATITSDSRWRGVSLSDTKPAIQLTADYFMDNGFFVGGWVSHIENGTTKVLDEGTENERYQLSGKQDIELHAWVGYTNTITDEIGYAGAMMFYNYPEQDAALSGFSEYIGTLYGYGFMAEYAYSDDFSGLGLTSHYADIDYEYSLVENLTLKLHAGHSWGDYTDAVNAGSYTDLSAGLTTNQYGFDFSLDVIHNIIDDSQKYNADNIYNNFVFTDNGDAVVLSVARKF